jgi:hypothetical protein
MNNKVDADFCRMNLSFLSNKNLTVLGVEFFILI